MIKDIFLVGIGSGIGGICRYLISVLMGYAHNGFPWGTFVANISGCLLIGILWGVTSRYHNISQAFTLLLMVGFCGGFTTFSTFMNENLLLGREGSMLSAILYTLASLALGLIAVLLGYQIVK